MLFPFCFHDKRYINPPLFPAEVADVACHLCKPTFAVVTENGSSAQTQLSAPLYGPERRVLLFSMDIPFPVSWHFVILVSMSLIRLSNLCPSPSLKIVLFMFHCSSPLVVQGPGATSPLVTCLNSYVQQHKVSITASKLASSHIHITLWH